MMLNVMLPSFEGLTFYFMLAVVVLIEGVLLNFGLKNKAFNRDGFVASLVINVVSTIIGWGAGLFSAGVFWMVGENDLESGYNLAILVALIISVVVEIIVAFLGALIDKSKVGFKRLSLFILLGNVITYFMLWLLFPKII